MVLVSADHVTKVQLGIKEDSVTDSEARQICEKIGDDGRYKASLSNNQLVIQRFIRD
jgi:hypothetical protein